MMNHVNDGIGESTQFLDFQQCISRAAKIDRPVLFIGERGSGKELAASRLHYLSNRWDKPFITLNCAALNPNLIETELFGHTQGAYTGAGTKRKGRFEEANEGTLFLDEIGLLPMEVQSKILRVVEYGVFEMVGSSTPIKTNVRIIGATNANLKEMARNGKFKADLLDRLSFEVLFLPPLRERKKDIMLLASHFASRIANELELEGVIEFSDNVIKQIHDYKWPGNIRELKNVIERAVYTSETNFIKSIKLDPFENPYITEEPTYLDNRDIVLKNFKDDIRQMEIDYLLEALKKSENRQKEAAELLNITYDQFRGLYRKYKNEIR
ncbi:AAA family ATPase [Thiospirochaeta perfilievii]|uniref:AAA family ATPase n=1 Tax=Thiospirochaeta perfilievii TaxID=252967 RepID=A0A5C1QCK5_9SPIO|nr:sigma 54-interacting transcriptional regulator [Thiospirochaeta perfilievii]QEN05187.1 AAA family ATPase [Thiospirochaeta perfilievii]